MAQGDINSNERNEAAQDEMLSAILQKLGANTSAGVSPPAQGTVSESGPSASGGGPGDILSSLLSNPELISKLPTIISSIKPIIEMLGKSNVGANDALGVAALPQKSEPAVTKTSKVNHASDSRTALLCAMKPYLSEDRRQAIDYIVKLGRLGELLKTL